MKYRKKPVVIDAVLNVPGERTPVWLPNPNLILGFPIKINTLEGVMTADIGDYIIKGIKGEVYLCKPDIFLASYEKVENEPIGDCSGSYDGSGSAYNYKGRR